MKSFNDISMGLFIVFVVVLVIEIYYVTANPKIKQVFDLNGDGVVSRYELKYALEQLEKKNKCLDFKALIVNSTAGAVRGFMTGMLIDGFEGAVAGAVVMSVINPIILGLEKIL